MEGLSERPLGRSRRSYIIENADLLDSVKKVERDEVSIAGCWNRSVGDETERECRPSALPHASTDGS
jgi:hypothetical protein